MSQTTKIAAITILLFFVFITLRGQLPSYIAVFFGAKKTSAPGVTQYGTVKPVSITGGTDAVSSVPNPSMAGSLVG